MTDVQVAALAVAGGLLVVFFTTLTWRMHAQVRRLAAEVATLKPLVQHPPVDTVQPLVEPQPLVELVETKARQPETVPIITRLSDDSPTDATDLSTARIASVTLGPPLIKVAAFTYGVRRALREEQRMRVSYAVRKELRRQRKLRRRSRRAVAPQGSGL